MKAYDLAQLATATYLTTEEAAAYTRRDSADAFRKFAGKAGIPKCRMGRAVLYLRRDVDEAIRSEFHRAQDRRTRAAGAA